MTIPTAIAGQQHRQRRIQPDEWIDRLDVSLSCCCCCALEPTIPAEAGSAVVVTLPRADPIWAANQILPSLSEVIPYTNEPETGMLASVPSPVLGSITAFLSMWYCANHIFLAQLD